MSPEPVQSGDSVPPILTIGYGGKRTSEDFTALLHRHGVKYLVDVRSKPFSKFRPEYSKDALEAILRRAGLGYLFMGDSLGGLPPDPTCFTDGKVDYDKVRGRDWFIRGIERLETGWRAGHHLCLMCAELEPERCHRSKLIGEALVARGVGIVHIDESGEIVSQATVLDRLNDGQGSLFDLGMTSRKRYGGDEEVA